MKEWVPIPPELVEQLKDTERRFKATFGRKPGKKDKVFFEQYLHQEDEFWSEVRKTGIDAGIDGRLLYASQRTERFLSDKNIHLLDQEELDEWDDACAEYDALVESGIDPFTALDFHSPDEYEVHEALMAAIDEAIISIGSFIDKNQAESGKKLKSFFGLYFSARAFNCTKLVKKVLEQSPSRDVIGVVRTVYECALRIRYVAAKEGAADAFLAQASVGMDHITQKTSADGKAKQGWITDLKTGMEFRSRFTFKEMAESSGRQIDSIVHDELYPFLSGVTHADVSDFHAYFSAEEGFFEPAHRYKTPEVPLLMVAISALLMAELRSIPEYSGQSRRDVSYVARKHARLLCSISQRFAELKVFGGMPGLSNRLKELGALRLRQSG
jgi:hypothetical protein